MTNFYITRCVILFMGQLIFATIIKAFPLTVTVLIKNAGENIILNWKLTQHDLGNGNLPIWYTGLHNEPELLPNVMSQIGDFAMYHDIEKSSAVVFFQSTGYFIGVVDTRFLIRGLPLNAINENKYFIVGGPYVERRGRSSEFHHDLIFPPVPGSQNFLPNSMLPTPQRFISSHRGAHGSCQGSSSSHNQHSNFNYVKSRPQNSDVLYAEMLVFISNNVVQQFRSYISLVVYYLVHFNSIDMLFAKLLEYGIEIHLNIAGFVIEDKEGVFPYVFKPNPTHLHILDATATLHSFPGYLEKYEHIFPVDSFDYFFLSTLYEMQDDDKIANGVARVNFDIHAYRISRTFLSAKYDSVGLLVHREEAHGDYITAAHEMAHVMGVTHDDVTEGSHCADIQCYAILQQFASYCKNCLRWSDRSRTEFQAFTSTNKNRCFLLNRPRSLYRHGIPIETLDASKQCSCYGFDSYWSGDSTNRLDEDSCDAPLVCAIRNAPVANPSPLPHDGTPCGIEKVCWGTKCEELLHFFK